MTALETMKTELSKILDKQISCLDDNGYVISSRCYEYQELCRTSREIKDAIEIWEKYFMKTEV